MALKKDHTPRFTRPMSNMRVVLMSIEQSNHSLQSIITDTKLHQGKVKSAILNLLYIKAILKSEDRQGRQIFFVQGQQVGPVGDCWMRAASVFHPVITKNDN